MARTNRRNRGQTIRRTQGDGTPKAPAQPTGTQVILSCGHVLYFSPNTLPTVGEDIYCRSTCGTVKVQEIKDEWRARCTQCTYGRKFGQAELTAHTMGGKHAITKGHTVKILFGDEVRHVVSTDQDELCEEPPF